MPSYWPWLEAYDPDIVYSYVPLNRADILEIHERLSPAHYKFHRLGAEPRLDVFVDHLYIKFEVVADQWACAYEV